jgi:hypothetical protein
VKLMLASAVVCSLQPPPPACRFNIVGKREIRNFNQGALFSPNAYLIKANLLDISEKKIRFSTVRRETQESSVETHILTRGRFVETDGERYSNIDDSMILTTNIPPGMTIRYSLSASALWGRLWSVYHL